MLITIGVIFALELAQISAFGATPDSLALLPQGDDNGPGAVYGVPPLVPQGDDNGPGAVYGVPPLVPQSFGQGH